MSTNFSLEARYFHPNLKLLSNSSTDLLHNCARKYQLYKLTDQQGFEETVETVHTDFGSIVGIGCQEYLVSRDYNKAVMLMLCSWKNMLDESAGEKDKKTFWHSLIALDAFTTERDSVLDEWIVPVFYNSETISNEAATELGFCIDCDDGFSYRGKLDALLRSTRTGEFAVLDFKTTGSSNTHEAQWKNRSQGLGYSLVVDAIAASLPPSEEYDGNVVENYLVMYWQYKSKSMEWEEFRFNKSHSQRAVFIRELLMDKQLITTYQEADFFPMNGSNCYSFFRPCKYFDICQLSDRNLIGPLEAVAIKKDKLGEYLFQFSLDDLITALLEKEV